MEGTRVRYSGGASERAVGDPLAWGSMEQVGMGELLWGSLGRVALRECEVKKSGQLVGSSVGHSWRSK